jgi:hypothetical protein
LSYTTDESEEDLSSSQNQRPLQRSPSRSSPEPKLVTIAEHEGDEEDTDDASSANDSEDGVVDVVATTSTVTFQPVSSTDSGNNSAANSTNTRAKSNTTSTSSTTTANNNKQRLATQTTNNLEMAFWQFLFFMMLRNIMGWDYLTNIILSKRNMLQQQQGGGTGSASDGKEGVGGTTVVRKTMTLRKLHCSDQTCEVVPELKSD